MGLLQKLLSTLGLKESSTGRGRERSGETTVTVEHEPDASGEATVKGTDGVSEDTAASGSTGTITDSGDEQVGAAEPSEAAGDATGGVDEDTEVEGAVESESEDEGESAEATESGEATDTTATADVGDADEADESESDAADAESTGSGEAPDVLNGIGPAYAERLGNAGVDTVDELASADASELADETGLGEGRIANWIEQAKES